MGWLMTRSLLLQMAAFFRCSPDEVLGLLTPHEKLHLVTSMQQRRRRSRPTVAGRALVLQ